MATHKHRCGEKVDGFHPDAGCGHVWEHDDSMMTAPKDVFKAAHTCPACGKGPWSYHYRPEDEEKSTAEELMGLLLKMVILRLELERAKQEYGL